MLKNTRNKLIIFITQHKSKKKEWARTAYLNKKSGLEKEKLENSNI
jgi:hypothetical protein